MNGSQLGRLSSGFFTPLTWRPEHAGGGGLIFAMIREMVCSVTIPLDYVSVEMSYSRNRLFHLEFSQPISLNELGAKYLRLSRYEHSNI